jgi:broad specificity phosphatase PhoE
VTTLWLVRHGQTDWNVEGRWQGQADPPLNTEGRAQAEALAARLNGIAFAALYASDLQRARETADVIARKIGRPVSLDARLREINQGEWEGMLSEQVQREYPAEWAARALDPLRARAPQGELVAQVAARAWAAADDIVRAHPVGPVLIVSHGLALATLLCRARGLPLEAARELIPDNVQPEVIEWRVAT